MKELINLNENNALAVFTEPGRIDPILDDIAIQARAIVADVSTKKGIETIRKNAANVAKSKAFIEKHGKFLADRQKEIPKLIDATRRRAKDFLDALQDEVRKPLTDLENAEKARVSALQERLSILRKLSGITVGADSHAIEANLQSAMDTVIDSSWDEYEDEASEVKDQTVRDLGYSLQEKKEFERLKKEEEIRIEQEREEEKARQAALIQCWRDETMADPCYADREKTGRVAPLMEIIHAPAKRPATGINEEREKAMHEQRIPDSESEMRQHKAKAHRQAVDDLKRFASITEEEAIRVLKSVVRGEVRNIAITY